MIYRPTLGLTAGSEEEGTFPGTPAQLPSTPWWLCLATVAPRGAMPVLPRGGSICTLQHPVLLRKVCLSHLLGGKHSPFLP